MGCRREKEKRESERERERGFDMQGLSAHVFVS